MQAFSILPDPRTGPAQRHDPKEMIVMTLSAMLCWADNWVDVAEWASDNEDWLKKYLVLENGTPSHDTFGRVFRLLDAAVFEQCFRRWIASIAVAVKQNQGKLFEAVQECYAEGHRHGFGCRAVSRFEMLEKDHGRIEARRHMWVGQLDRMEPSLRGDWKSLAGVGMVERQRESKGQVSVERTFCIGSKGIASAQALSEAARGSLGN
ncbi:hypothetical protein BH10PSE16_BH10PSE16_19280 [soil metagenome]